VSHWTHFTMEQARIQTRLLELGVGIVALHNLAAIHGNHVELACNYTGARQTLACGAVVMVTMREAADALYRALDGAPGAAPKSVTRIVDCLAPGTIAAAVYSGHRFARELGEPAPDGVPFRRELPTLAGD